EVRNAVESAMAWFESNKLSGVRWERTKEENRVIKDRNAPPLWARFYQIETMKPIFIGRDSVIRYDVMKIEAERRNGYAWYVDGARELLEKDYPAWKAKINAR
ncbi:MAG TPA: pectate lyase, partial [Pyrinomonadaceae bacterium]|nr:pectate lyase [Pyrinomonadaceae bacterium]